MRQEATGHGAAVGVGAVHEDDLRVAQHLEQVHPDVGLVRVRRHRAQERAVYVLPGQGGGGRSAERPELEIEQIMPAESQQQHRHNTTQYNTYRTR